MGFAFSCDADRLERAGLAAEGDDVYDAPDAGAVRSALLRRLVPRVLDLVNRIAARLGRQPVGALDLLVADASDPYDENAFWTCKSQRLVYQIVVPSLHLANGADRRALHAELLRDNVLGPLVDEGAYWRRHDLPSRLCGPDFGRHPKQQHQRLRPVSRLLHRC